MVATTSAISLDATRYQAFLDSIYDSIEGLPTVGYQDATSDRWHRARAMASMVDREHLLCLVAPRSVGSVHPWAFDYEMRLVFAHRYQPTDDVLSQARMMASIAHVVQCVEGWTSTDGGSVLRVTGGEIEPHDEQWTDVLIDFILRLPRG